MGGLSGTLHVAAGLAPDELSQVLFDPGEATEVLLFGPGMATEDALRLASIVDVQHPEISLVLAARPDPELALSAMRAGIRDILDPGSEPEAIRVLVERACRSAESRMFGTNRKQQSAPKSGLIIVVASSKGGVGKTTLATNIAVSLGRIAPMSTVLVDLDAQFGDVSSALRIDPEHTLLDAVTGAAKDDSMVLKAFLSVHHSSIYALCAPGSPAEADGIRGDDVAHLLEQLASEFRYVVVDTAPGLGEQTLAALEKATEGVFVCTMDVPSVRGLRKELDVMNQLGFASNRCLVVNMGDPSGGLSVSDIEATIGARVDLVVPRSKDVAYSTNTGEPLLQRTTKGAAAKALDRLAGRFDPARQAEMERGRHKREALK